MPAFVRRLKRVNMTLLYTMNDPERETVEQPRMFDELLGMPGSEKGNECHLPLCLSRDP